MEGLSQWQVSLQERGRGGCDSETQGRRHVRTEAEAGMLLPQAKERLEPPEAGRGSSATTLVSGSGLHNHRRTKSHLCELPSLCYPVTSASGNKHRQRQRRDRKQDSDERGGPWSQGPRPPAFHSFWGPPSSALARTLIQGSRLWQ